MASAATTAVQAAAGVMTFGSSVPFLGAPGANRNTFLGHGLLGPYMGIGGNVYKTPTPPEAPAPIAADNTAVQRAAANTAAVRARSQGFQSTILSSLMTTPSGTGGLKTTYGS